MRSEPNKAHEMVRVVVDTNVLVSTLVGRGKPRILVFKLLEKHSVVLSREMLAELADVLSREKFKEVRNSQADKFLSRLVHKSKLVTVRSSFKVVTADPADDIVLNTAYDGDTEYVVTGDKHLLALTEFKGIKIVKVTRMLEIITNH